MGRFGMYIWKTKDGRELKPKDMEDKHLLSTIRLMERKAPEYKEHLDDYYEGWLDEYSPWKCMYEAIPIYKLLVREAIKRKLLHSRYISVKLKIAKKWKPEKPKDMIDQKLENIRIREILGLL
jgi:hypothetical protein